MADKSWMLNPQAIRHARECIVVIKRDFKQSLKLSDDDFLQQLHEKVELGKSSQLGTAYAKLIAMAGVGSMVHNLRQRAQPVVAAPIRSAS